MFEKLRHAYRVMKLNYYFRAYWRKSGRRHSAGAGMV